MTKRRKRSGHGQRYEVQVAGTWFPARRKSQRPRVGGWRIAGGRPPLVLGRIDAVREHS